MATQLTHRRPARPAGSSGLGAADARAAGVEYENGARRNVEAHYDLSNEMFATFLDETMTYSCAGSIPGTATTATTAMTVTAWSEPSLRKIDGVLDAAGVRSAAGCWRSAPAGRT